MAAAAILDFIFVQYFGMHVCRTLNVMQLPNFVQICAIVNELWAIDEIQNTVCAKIQDGAAVILDFIFVQYFGMLVCRISKNTHTKFRAIMCNNKRVMSNKW